MKHKILIVDDEQPNLRALARLVSNEYEPVTANSGREAMELLSQHNFSMIISDQRMPEMSGLDFLKHAAQFRHQTIRILLTGYTDIDTLVEAINSGVVYKYVTKPWSNDDLMQLIRRALEHFDSIKNGQLSNHDISRLNQKLEAAKKGLLALWSENIKLRSPELFDHAERISRYARAISDLLPIEPKKTELTATAASLFPYVYTIAAVPEILAGVSVGDSELSVRTAELESALAVFSELRTIEDLAEIGNIIRFANEYYDGTGFPNRLAGESIPLASRILSVVRGYDLLTSAPIEGFTLSHDEAIAYMLNSGGSRVYDPSIVEILNGVGFASQVPENTSASHPIVFGVEPSDAWISIS